MCGRYNQARSLAELAKRFQTLLPDEDFAALGEVAPTQSAPVVRREGQANRLQLMRWGLNRSINARSETVTQKPTFSGLLSAGRCLIPADGFYEWTREGKRKARVRFTIAEEAVFAMAGLFENGNFVVLTTTPNADVASIHDRMPVILKPEDEGAWLTAPAKEAVSLLRPLPDGVLRLQGPHTPSFF